MYDILIKNGLIINRGQKVYADILIGNGRIERVDSTIDASAKEEIDATGKWVLPGLIDDQVHFREPGLTHKADIHSESRAALAGGVTSFMEMPNTKPTATTQEELEKKYQVAEQHSPANYSFYLGATNDNLEEVLKTDPAQVCGIKIFMGSSTGNMLVDDREVLERIFKHTPMLIATHCEDEATIRRNLAKAEEQYGDKIPIGLHPWIRSREGCLLSSQLAVELAGKYGTRLHILHISTEDELELFTSGPLEGKHITAEVCVHHLSFSAEQYAALGNGIKCNPAIKQKSDQEALWKALHEDRLDVIATDHAPHTIEEKAQSYLLAPSGLPLVQHSLALLLQHHFAGRISLEKIVEKACHAPARMFAIRDRGYLDSGYWADLVIVDPGTRWTVHKENLLYKCGWSPLEGREMQGRAEVTIVNGNVAFRDGVIAEGPSGKRLEFNRPA